ncbi:hypothetical protein ACV56Z_09830 [Staphylococcus aureus]
MHQGASCDYMTVAEAEEIEQQKKKEEAIEIAALAGMVVLSCINPVAGAVAIGAIPLISSKCSHRKKYCNWKKAI